MRYSSSDFVPPGSRYPLYSATVQMLGGSLVPYLLDEKKGWGMNIDLLKESVLSARRKGIMVRGLVVINPGNPTGQCLERGDLEDIIKFCIRERVTLLADEVYQVNVYQSKHPFVSFKKVRQMSDFWLRWLRSCGHLCNFAPHIIFVRSCSLRLSW